MYNLREAAHIKIRSSAVEGDCQIKRVFCIEYSYLKGFIFALACIATFGIVWIISFWLPRYKRKFLYQYAPLETCSHFLVLNWDNEWTIVRKQLVTVQRDESSFFQAVGMTNRFIRYYYDNRLDHITAVEYPYESTLYKEFHSYRTRKTFLGIQTQLLATQALSCYGSCGVGIPMPSTFKMFLKVLLHPFFLFQLYSIALWIYEEYYYFVTMIILMSIYSLISDVYLERQNWVNLSKMANSNTLINEFAAYDPLGPVRQVCTNQLICGTIIYVNENFKLPADCVLLEGECLVDEAALTGESIPAIKHRIEHTFEDIGLKKRNILYEGTTILQISKTDLMPKSMNLPCLVIATNFTTIRGQLLRSIMFPKPHKFKFFTESIQFLIVLGFITLIGFFILLPDMLNKAQAGLWDVILTLLDSITITIPPSLPAAMNFGISFALERLRKSQIYCIQPPKIIVSGRIDTICFDKTGTLTQQGMKISEILPSDTSKTQGNDKLLDCMVCCQSLVKVRKELQRTVEKKIKSQKNLALAEDVEIESKIIGDPMEVQLFLHAEGDLVVCDDSKEYRSIINRQQQSFGVRKRFDFTSETQRMSVLVQDIQTSQYYLFVKGAPEVLEGLCSSKNNYGIYSRYSQQGLRIIALAYKPVPIQSLFLGRQDLETNLIFLGFAVFENQLKPESPRVLQQLRRANIDCKIVTGDNYLTALQVAEQCYLIEKPIKVIEDQDQQIRVRVYQSPAHLRLCQPLSDEIIGEGSWLVDQSQSPDKIHRPRELGIDELLVPQDHASYNIVMTGRIFGVLAAETTTFGESVDMVRFQQWKEIMLNSVVFSRMKPQQKVQLIEILQFLNRTVGMVGDGANDCGALKQADSGLDLSETETSISAPFTSSVLNVGSVITLLRNGRAALSTNFQCFKFMALYSLIQYVSTIILSFTFAEFSDMQFLYIDLFIICPIFTTMALTEPYEELSVQRPSISLFSLQCMISVFGQVFLQTMAQVSLMLILMRQDFYPGVEHYQKEYLKTGNFIVNCVDSTTNFVFTNFLYVASIMAFSVSKPFRKPFYSNITFTINIALIWTLNILLTFYPWARLPQMHFYDPTPQNWLIFVVGYAHIWCLIFYLWENVVCVNLFLRFSRSSKQHESYKWVEGAYSNLQNQPYTRRHKVLNSEPQEVQMISFK